MSDDIHNLGWLLIEDSRNEEFSAQRGIMFELFPFIYEASQRMSARAISRWLESNKIKLSPATVSKALREPKQYWEAYFEEIEPFARIVERAHSVELRDLLLDPSAFECATQQTPSLEAISDEMQREAYNEYEGAVGTLKARWFAFSPRFREACLSYVNLDEEKEANEL